MDSENLFDGVEVVNKAQKRKLEQGQEIKQQLNVQESKKMREQSVVRYTNKSKIHASEVAKKNSKKRKDLFKTLKVILAAGGVILVTSGVIKSLNRNPDVSIDIKPTGTITEMAEQAKQRLSEREQIFLANARQEFEQNPIEIYDSIIDQRLDIIKKEFQEEHSDVVPDIQNIQISSFRTPEEEEAGITSKITVRNTANWEEFEPSEQQEKEIREVVNNQRQLEKLKEGKITSADVKEDYFKLIMDMIENGDTVEVGGLKYKKPIARIQELQDKINEEKEQYER